jgi:hypothetical protein
MTDFKANGTAPAPGYDARGKNAAEIEGDIDRTRAELGVVLDALERRLAPRHLVETGMDMLKDRIGGNWGTMLREHPVPLALIGAGIGWLIVAETAGDRAAAAARSVGDRVKGAVGAFAERADEVAAETSETLYPAGEEFTGYAYARTKPSLGAAASVVEHAEQAMAGVCAGYRRAVDTNPLAFGLIGLIAGVALGMVLPRLGLVDALRRDNSAAGARPREDADAAGHTAATEPDPMPEPEPAEGF